MTYVTRSSTNMRKSGGKKLGKTTKKVLIVVTSNLLCWIPVIITVAANMAGVSIDQHIMAWIAVFIIPLNAASDPILYTLSAYDIKNVLLKNKDIGKKR